MTIPLLFLSFNPPSTTFYGEIESQEKGEELEVSRVDSAVKATSFPPLTRNIMQLDSLSRIMDVTRLRGKIQAFMVIYYTRLSLCAPCHFGSALGRTPMPAIRSWFRED